jgi:hypothetical protein
MAGQMFTFVVLIVRSEAILNTTYPIHTNIDFRGRFFTVGKKLEFLNPVLSCKAGFTFAA